MRLAKLNLGTRRFDHLRKATAGALLLAGMLIAPAMGQQKDQKTFSSAEEASRALYAAVKSNDEKALLEVLGQDGKEIISSGDPSEDAENRATFAQRYEQMHRLVKEPDGTVTMYIGAMNWPCPIPIVTNNQAWYLDTRDGKREILMRRVGRNEMSAIHICYQLAAAQKEYYSQHSEYAQKIFSEEGKRDGLYWKAGESAAPSPIGPLVAQAVTDKFAADRQSSAVPYRGYFFHVLTAQGKNAPGGAKNYIVDGKMTGGFAFVAYPAGYRSSGVKTLVVGPDGKVYGKDLGRKTEALAKSMSLFNLDASWESEQEESGEQASK